jgi:hypothetical protein
MAFVSNATFNGSSVWKFTTNNQNILLNVGIPTLFGTGGVLISGAITVTNSGSQGFVLTGAINGDNALSTFDNRGVIQYKSPTAPMLTGVLQTNAAINTWLYNLNGAQDVKDGTYRNLTLSIGGAKKLLGNVSVVNTYSLVAPATLNSNGFALTNP